MEIDRIICGDNVEVMRGFPDACIDLTVTSPPYDNLRTYNGYSWDFENVAKQLYRVTKQGGVVVWVVGDATINGSETGTSFKQALYFMECGFNLHDTMIYKTNKPPMNDNRYQASFEFMFVLSRGKPKTFNAITEKSKWAGSKPGSSFRKKDGDMKQAFHNNPIGETKIRGNVWDIDSGYMKTTTDKQAFIHPAMFPEKLARDHILSWSNLGDLILDPFIGSGTTAKMAKESGRHWIGIDCSADYCALAQKRIEGANVPLFMETK